MRLSCLRGGRLHDRADTRDRRGHDELTTVLLTLGRLPKALELARAFASAGCRVVVAEPHRWHLSRVSRHVARSYAVPAPNSDLEAYYAAVAAIAERERADLVVPVSDETMYVAGLHGRLPARARLYCPSSARILELHDKLAFVRLAERHGLAVPETHLATAPAAAALLARRRCVTKPIYSAAGTGFEVLDAGAPAPAGAGGEPRVVQAFVPGAELSSFSVAHEGRVIGTVVYRGLIMSGTVAVCFERLAEPPPALLEWVRAFAAATDHSGFLSFDFRLDEHGAPLAIECNPRTTSGVHFVEPTDLACAVLTPARATSLRVRDVTRLQQFYPALTEVQSAALRGRRVRHLLRHLFTTRDVCWELADPLPLLLMPVASWPILERCIFRGETFGKASTVDITWHPAPPGAPGTESAPPAA